MSYNAPTNTYSVMIIEKRSNQVIETKEFESVVDATRFIEENEDGSSLFDYRLSRKTLLVESV